MTDERTMWKQILPRWRAAHQAARTATHAQRSVLEAVLYLLASYQRAEDRISLGQIAYEAGMHEGPGPCAKSTRIAVSRHLQALAEMGALTVAKGGEDGRTASLISLPPNPAGGIGHEHPRGAHDEHPRGMHDEHPQTPAASTNGGMHHARPGARTTNTPGARTSTPQGRASEAPGGIGEARPTEGSPRGFSRGENTRGATARTEPPASVAPTTPDDMDDDAAPADEWVAPPLHAALFSGHFDLEQHGLQANALLDWADRSRLPPDVRRIAAEDVAIHPRRYKTPADLAPALLAAAHDRGIYPTPPTHEELHP